MEDDLQSLLSKLESDGVEEEPKQEIADDAHEEPSSKIEQEISDIESNSLTTLTKIMEVDTPTSGIDINKYLNRLDNVTEEILTACRADRQEAQDVIQMLRHEIEQSLNSSRAPARMFVDGLVKAVEVKANINSTAVKMIEANAKMLASMKANANVQVNNQNVTVAGNDSDLERILNEPLSAEDEY